MDVHGASAPVHVGTSILGPHTQSRPAASGALAFGLIALTGPRPGHDKRRC